MKDNNSEVKQQVIYKLPIFKTYEEQEEFFFELRTSCRKEHGYED